MNKTVVATCLLLLLAACGSGLSAQPAATEAAATISAGLRLTADHTLPPTWTSTPILGLPEVGTPQSAPSTPLATPRPSKSPWPTATPSQTSHPPTAAPTATPTPTDTYTPAAPPTRSATPVATGPNLLPNPSFEGGAHHPYDIPELEVPSHWTFEWEEGANPFDPDPWNAFVRPECRVLSKAFLPPREHSTFIWDGDHTVKVFKGQGATSFRLTSHVYLETGSYVLEINVFPDLVASYQPDGSKVWAADPLAGEVRLIVGNSGGSWTMPVFGEKNTVSLVFGMPAGQVVRVGAAMRGRWAIANNGWFLDDWSLRRIDVQP